MKAGNGIIESIWYFFSSPAFSTVGNRKRVTAQCAAVFALLDDLKRFLFPFSQNFCFTKSFVSEYHALACMQYACRVTSSSKTG